MLKHSVYIYINDEVDNVFSLFQFSVCMNEIETNFKDVFDVSEYHSHRTFVNVLFC